MDNEQDIYYNEFFEGIPQNLSGQELQAWLEENRDKTFKDLPLLKKLTKRDIWEDKAKFYFLPFLINCYNFTRQHKLPYFTLMCSPTFIFYRDRLHLRNWMDTIHKTFFKCLDMVIPKGEKIMLLVEKRFHIENPIAGGTQQLYNMLWDCDLTPDPKKVRILAEQIPTFNPDMPVEGGLDLCRKTLWLEDDLLFLGKKYTFIDQYESEYEYDCDEILDLSNLHEDRQPIWEKTARHFYFKVFEPKDAGEQEIIPPTPDEEDDPEYDDFDVDSSQSGMLDSTLDFEEDESEMNKIVAFFAKMPKVTGLVQGMLDMMAALARILPLVAVKLEEDPKLKDALGKTVNIINLGIGKVLKICAYLGIKVERKEGDAVKQIVKNRFKKDKKEFLDYEIDELNKSLDALEKVDDEPENPKPPKGQIPLDVKPNHLYPQKMPLGPHPPHPIVVPPEPPPVQVPPPPPPKPPKPEDDPP